MLEPGAQFGRYRIERRLGAGAMGTVYAAHDRELARDVALKLVRPRGDEETMTLRLRREGQAMARLSHRNVVPVFDIGSHGGHLFVAMELVDGPTLRTWLAGPRPWREIVRMFAAAGRGLEAAHAAGLVHRDFKPDNVMVGEDGEPRITDFGLARELEAPVESGDGMPGSSDVTATGHVAGTPAYMAPEQLRGRPAGPAADQFSFCVTLFEALYGARPFRPAINEPVGQFAEIYAQRIVKPPGRHVPAWLHAVVVRGLAFDPERRWPSMHALVGALERKQRKLRFGGGLAAVAMVAGMKLAYPEKAPSCADLAAEEGNDIRMIAVCREEYARTSDPRAGIELAKALRRSGERSQASELARGLLVTEAQGDALYTLGMIAREEHRRDDAIRMFELASHRHRADLQWAESLTDLLVLAQLSNDWASQLVTYDQIATDARQTRDTEKELYGRLNAALVMSKIGAASGAHRELARAGGLAQSPRDRVTLELLRGDVEQNLGDQARAVEHFQRALAGAEAATARNVARSARQNLAYSLAELRKLDDARAQLAAATRLDPQDQARSPRLSLEAQVAEYAGDLARAAELADNALRVTGPDSVEERIELETQRAGIALRRGQLDVADAAARAAIKHIEVVRSSNAPVELRSWLIIDRRLPYEIQFAVRARRGEAAEALRVFDRWQGLEMLAGLLRTPGGRDGAYPAAELARLLPALATSRLVAPGEAAAAAPLLALVGARSEVWRIATEGGALRATKLGALATLRDQVERLRAAPGDRALAAELGDLLVPAELAAPSAQPLHVLLDGPLAGLPVAALRPGGRLLVAARPVVRASRLADLTCVPARARPADVEPVTAEALLDAGAGALLHVSAAVEPDDLGPALVLRDRRVPALELAARGATAARVVVAASDAGALATAFLAAGAEQVIASTGPVPAGAARRLVERLLRAPAEPDLPRALAQLQTDETPEWLGFAAFGRATCPRP